MTKPKSRRRTSSRRKPRRFDRLRRILAATPPSVRTMTALIAAVGLFLLTNLIYHIIHKPTEMLYPVSGVLKKSPAETWREYGPLFREFSTANVSPELLAALAQNEGAGDPIAHTYWRWRLAWPPFEMYKPASSAVGMYQMTDPTFADAERYCIRDHVVLDRSTAPCRAEDFYNRLIPSHSIELTAAHLDRSVAAILGRQSQATARQRQDLAALIHLCGGGPARDFVRHGFRLTEEKCGDHSAKTYADRVETMILQFKRLESEER